MPPKVIDKRARRDDRDDLPDGGPTVAIDVSDDVGPAARRGGHGRPAERAGSAGDARDVSAGGAGPDEHAFLERMEARLDEVKEALDARERELDKRAGRLERQERELHELLQDCRDCERSLSASWDELEKQAKQVRELAQELGSASSRLLKIEDETRRSNAADAARRPAR
jgi:small-conductance mechanosensitive channel